MFENELRRFWPQCDAEELLTARTGQGEGAEGQGCAGQSKIGTEFHQHFHWQELGAAQLTCGLTPLPLWKRAA